MGQASALRRVGPCPYYYVELGLGAHLSISCCASAVARLLLTKMASTLRNIAFKSDSSMISHRRSWRASKAVAEPSKRTIALVGSRISVLLGSNSLRLMFLWNSCGSVQCVPGGLGLSHAQRIYTVAALLEESEQVRLSAT